MYCVVKSSRAFMILMLCSLPRRAFLSNASSFIIDGSLWFWKGELLYINITFFFYRGWNKDAKKLPTGRNCITNETINSRFGGFCYSGHLLGQQPPTLSCLICVFVSKWSVRKCTEHSEFKDKSFVFFVNRLNKGYLLNDFLFSFSYIVVSQYSVVSSVHRIVIQLFPHIY